MIRWSKRSTARLPANLQNPTQMRDAVSDIGDSMSDQMTDLGFDSDGVEPSFNYRIKQHPFPRRWPCYYVS